MESLAFKRRKSAPAVTLVETMVSIVVVGILALGGLGYQYHAAGHIRVARGQIVATRIAQLLIEDWKSTGGSDEYDPETLGIGFSPVPPQAGIAGSAYSIVVDGFPMIATLAFDDVDYDEEAEIKLRLLAVVVEPGQTAPETGVVVASAAGPAAPVTMLTYVRFDASGG